MKKKVTILVVSVTSDEESLISLHYNQNLSQGGIPIYNEIQLYY